MLPKEMWSEWENVCGKKIDVVRMGKCLCGKGEMRLEWESVCGKKRDAVRMGKLAVRRKEWSIKINVSVEGKGCGMGLGMYRNIGSVLECGYE